MGKRDNRVGETGRTVNSATGRQGNLNLMTSVFSIKDTVRPLAENKSGVWRYEAKEGIKWSIPRKLGKDLTKEIQLLDGGEQGCRNGRWMVV